MKLRTTLSVTLVVWLVAGLGAGQEPASDAAPSAPVDTFQEVVDVQVVNVEVRVSDKKGVPITGLGLSDFEIRENGLKIEPQNFAEVKSTEVGGGPVHLVMYIDNRNTRTANRDRAIEELSAQLPPLFEGTKLRASVVTYDGQVRVALRPTTDVAAVQQALAEVRATRSIGDDRDSYRRSAQTTATDSFQKARGTDSIDRRNAAMGIDALLGEMRTYAREVQSDTEGSLQALASVVRSLAWEDGKKALVYVSDGLVERPLGTFIQHAQTLMTGGATTAGDLVESRSGGQGTAGGGDGLFNRDSTLQFNRLQQEVEPRRSTATLEALIAEANTYGVSFYAAKAPPGDAEGGGRRSQGRGSLIELSDRREALHLIGDGTGGFARTTGTSLAGFLPEAIKDLGSYYSFGLSTADKQVGDSTLVDIKVKKRGARARYRNSYIKKNRPARIADRAMAALLLREGDNQHLLEVAVEEMVAAEGGMVDVRMRLEIPIKSVQLAGANGMHTSNARMVVVAMDADDTLTAAQHLGFPLQVPSDQLADAIQSYYRATVSLRLPEGPQRLAFGFWDEYAQSGSVVTDEVTISAN